MTTSGRPPFRENLNFDSMLVLALEYARCGVAIFPCRERDGKSAGAKAPYNEGGWHYATTDERQLRYWWQKWPRAVPGLPCRLNGIIAVDADRHGNEDGVDHLFDLFTAFKFGSFSVPYVQTPNHGLHCLFRRPPLLGDTKARIAPAIDIRDNAYIISAGSIMANGLVYTLQNGSLKSLAEAIGGDTLPILPGWLAAMMIKPLAIPQSHYASSVNSIGDLSGLRRRLSGLVRTVALARPGERNATLHWAACRVAELVQAGLITEEVAYGLFTKAGTYAGLSTRETIATVKSGLAKGKARDGR